jgi:hypothetical protein
MSEEADLEQQLKLLRAMTEEYGCIHDAQAYQLKRYPFALSNVTSAEVHVSVIDHKVEFVIATKGKARNEKAACQFIDNCVKTLLGDTWLVNIKTKTKTLYRGRRKKAFKPKEITDGGSN